VFGGPSGFLVKFKEGLYPNGIERALVAVIVMKREPFIQYLLLAHFFPVRVMQVKLDGEFFIVPVESQSVHMAVRRRNDARVEFQNESV
jgi:hypothetical protein